VTTLDEWGYKLTEVGFTESHVFLGVYIYVFPVSFSLGLVLVLGPIE